MTLQPLPSGGSLETRPSLLQRLQSGDEKEQTSARQLGRSRTGRAEVVKGAGGLSYGSGAQAVRRFEKGLRKDGKKPRFVQVLRRRINQGVGIQRAVCERELSPVRETYRADPMARAMLNPWRPLDAWRELTADGEGTTTDFMDGLGTGR